MILMPSEEPGVGASHRYFAVPGQRRQGCQARRGAGLSIHLSRWLQTKRRDVSEIICCGLQVEEG